VPTADIAVHRINFESELRIKAGHMLLAPPL